MTTENKNKRNYAKRTANEYHLLRSIFFKFVLWFMVDPICKFMYNTKVIGIENIPKDRTVIFTANHVSEMDPPFMAHAVRRRTAYMAKQELFDKNEPRSWIIKRLGAFSVNRDKPELSTFKTVKEIFKTDWNLGIFPQGGTRPNGKIEDIKKGFISIAKHAKADIVPVSIVGFDGYAEKLFEKHITIVIGKPISYELEADDILQQWCAEICKNTGFENCMLNEVALD